MRVRKITYTRINILLSANYKQQLNIQATKQSFLIKSDC